MAISQERLRAIIAAPEEIAVSRDELCEAIVAMRGALERIDALDEAMGHELTVSDAFAAIRIAREILRGIKRVPAVDSIVDY